MRTMVVIIGEPSAKAGTQFRSGLEGVQIDAFVLHRPPEPLDEDIVHPAPRPSMLILISAARSTPVKALLVNWLP